MHAGPSGTSHGSGILRDPKPEGFCWHSLGPPPPKGLPGRSEGASFPPKNVTQAALKGLRALAGRSNAPGWQILGTRASRAGPRGQPMKAAPPNKLPKLWARFATERGLSCY